MSRLTPAKTTIQSLPDELLLLVVNKINIRDGGCGFLRTCKKFSALAIESIHKRSQACIKSHDANNDGKDIIIKDLNLQKVGVCKRGTLSPPDQLLRIERRERDWEILCHLLENVTLVSSYDGLGVDVYYIYELFDAFSEVEDILNICHALEDCHYLRFACTNRINLEVSRWSEKQFLEFALMSQAFGQLLYLFRVADLRPAGDKRITCFEYMQAVKLVLLLWGPRPIMLAILDATKTHLDKDISKSLLEGIRCGEEDIPRDLRKPREMEADMAVEGWEWTTLPVNRHTFNRALWHVRFSHWILENMHQMPAYPALFTGRLPIGDGPHEIDHHVIVEDYGRPDLIVDAMMGHMMDNSEWTWLEDPYHLRNAIRARRP